MSGAAPRAAALLALAWAMAGCTLAADTPRAVPSRPGAPPAAAVRPLGSVPSRKLGDFDCVAVDDLAKYLGLKTAERERGRVVTLTGIGTSAELESDTRDITINGLRVFLGFPVVRHRGDLYVTRIDFERCLAPLLRPGYGVPPVAAPRTIVIDPGHGGKDFGKINDQLKINEKTFALDTGLRLKKLLEADGYRVIMTREDDRFLELPERPAVANRANADLFISIHFNALDKDRKTSGVEVYTFAPQNQRSTEAWMAGQKDDTQTTPEPANAFDYWNVLLAQSLHRPFVMDLKASDRGKKLMHLGVLRSLRCPGALVECGFLTSDVEARKISTPAYRQDIAEALRRGVQDYAAMVGRVRVLSGLPATSAVRRSSRSL